MTLCPLSVRRSRDWKGIFAGTFRITLVIYYGDECSQVCQPHLAHLTSLDSSECPVWRPCENFFQSRERCTDNGQRIIWHLRSLHYLFPRATSQVAMLAWIFGDCREGQIPTNFSSLRSAMLQALCFVACSGIFDSYSWTVYSVRSG